MSEESLAVIMETSFILEKKIVALCFNPTKETIFLLYPDLSQNSYNSTSLLLTEEDLLSF